MKFTRHSKYLKNPFIVFLVAVISFGIAIVIILRILDASAFKDAIRQAGNEPMGVIFALCAFMVAFFLRAIAWKKVLPTISLNQSLAGIVVEAMRLKETRPVSTPTEEKKTWED